jgi:hypothetical protein
MVLHWAAPFPHLRLKQFKATPKSDMSSVQILTAAAFWLFLIAGLLTVAISGGRTGRLFALVLVTCAVATFIANSVLDAKSAPLIVLGIDLSLLIFVATLALYESSYWPLWFTGFHSISVATGLAHLLFPVKLSEIYVDAAGFWALPALAAAAAGVILDHRQHFLSSRQH